MNTTKTKFHLTQAVIITEAKILSSNSKKTINCQMIIDTGASKTTISDKLLKDLGYEPGSEGFTNKKIASGIVKVKQTKIISITTINRTIKNLIIESIPKPIDKKIEGVIGMDILSQYNITINFNENTITLVDR